MNHNETGHLHNVVNYLTLALFATAGRDYLAAMEVVDRCIDQLQRLPDLLCLKQSDSQDPDSLRRDAPLNH